jgi:hypothetical protein
MVLLSCSIDLGIILVRHRLGFKGLVALSPRSVGQASRLPYSTIPAAVRVIPHSPILIREKKRKGVEKGEKVSKRKEKVSVKKGEKVSVNGIDIFPRKAQEAAWLASYEWNIRARFIT